MHCAGQQSTQQCQSVAAPNTRSAGRTRTRVEGRGRGWAPPPPLRVSAQLLRVSRAEGSTLAAKPNPSSGIPPTLVGSGRQPYGALSWGLDLQGDPTGSQPARGEPRGSGEIPEGPAGGDSAASDAEEPAAAATRR